MKINYNKNTQPFESIQEEPLSKRRWDRWIYMGVLLVLAFTFIRWLTLPWFFNTAQGVLLQQGFEVQLPFDARIVQYKVKESQQVKKGDTLFYYEWFGEGHRKVDAKQDSIQMILNQNKSQRDHFELDTQIEKRKRFLVDLNKRLNYWKAEKKHKEKLVYLQVITPNELATVDRLLDDLAYQMATTKTEYVLLQKERQKLQNGLQKDNTLTYQNLALSKATAAFRSPVNGKVDRLRVQPQEICAKQNIITSIVTPTYFVKAYIEMGDLDDFKVNQHVVVILPYKSKDLQGKVAKIYTVSEAKDEVVIQNTVDQQKYGVVIEIVPDTTIGWDKLAVSNIPVKIRKGKINL